MKIFDLIVVDISVQYYCSEALCPHRTYTGLFSRYRRLFCGCTRLCSGYVGSISRAVFLLLSFPPPFSVYRLNDMKARVLLPSHSLTLSLSHVLTLARSRSFCLAYFLSLSLSLSPSLSPSLSFSLSLVHSPSFIFLSLSISLSTTADDMETRLLSRSFSLTHTRTSALLLSPCLLPFLSLTRSLSFPPSLCLCLSVSLSRALALSLSRSFSFFLALPISFSLCVY